MLACRVQEDRLQSTVENSDSGWVTTSGVGAYQLRIGQPAGSKDPLVSLRTLPLLCRSCVALPFWQNKSKSSGAFISTEPGLLDLGLRQAPKLACPTVQNSEESCV